MVSIAGKTKDGKPIRSYEGDCLIISMDGSAGCMTYKKAGQRFTINHHAALLYAKDDKVVNLQYFKLKYENTFKSLAVSDGSKTISVERIKELSFMLPDKKLQDALVERFEIIRVIQNGLLGKKMAIELEVNA